MRSRPVIVLGVLAMLFLAARARAEDAFYRVPFKDLKLTEGKLPEPKLEGDWSQRGMSIQPRVHLEAGDGGDGVEAYVSYSSGAFSPAEWANNAGGNYATLVFRAPAGKDVAGRLYVPAPDWKSMTSVRCSIPAAAADPKAREAFFEAKRQHYEALLAEGVPGAAWFRHQAREADRANGINRQHVREQEQPDGAIGTDRADAARPAPPQPPGEFDDTYSLFSGGRALSENLQLDRVLLPRTGGGDATVAVDSLAGITVKEMNWKPLIADKHPQTDRLAALIPADQHAIFFPTFAAAMTLVDEADRQGTPVLESAEPRSEDARTKDRYQRQLCLSLTGLGRLLGPTVINGLAVTGSDPYLRVGTDVAILFEPKDSAATLRGLLSVQTGLAATTAGPGAKAVAVSGNAGGVAYTGYVSSDRRICFYLATVGDAVAVTNSLVQLQRLADVQAGRFKAIDTAPEYTFFRDRYRRGEGDESALVVLTDATIRRWCSARWRIADSRRTRAAALMAEVQASYLDKLAAGTVEAGPIHSENGLAEAGEMRLTPAGVTSSVYGNLEFMTPIAELDLTKVTQPEADTYVRWRDTYQQNWSNYFDPIAIRFSDSADQLGADLTVMPLIAGSEYQKVIQFTRGAKLLPGTGDPHNALLHLALAVNTKSDEFRQLGGMASGLMPQLKVDPLSWLGQTVAVYVDDDPIWEQAAKAEWSSEFFQDHFSELPVALYVQSSSALKLTAFLTVAHGFVDQSAPGMTVWEPLKYNDQFYVKVSPSAQAKTETKELRNAALYYTTAGGALLITPSEALLKRALDRQAARVADGALPAAPLAKRPAGEAAPWLGDNFCVQVNAMGLLRGLLRDTYEPEMQRQAWGNLPILNEWYHRFPGRDPVQLHEQLWQVRLIDPAGGSYVWSEKLGTMESTVYGCPESPKSGPGLPPVLAALRRANFGISFDAQGMRARAKLDRGGPEQTAAAPTTRPAKLAE